MRPVFFIILIVCFVQVHAQQKSGGKAKTKPADTSSFVFPKYAIVDGDTLYMVGSLPQVTVYSPRYFKDKKLQKKYDRLVYHVKKVYPYAKRAGEVLKEEEANMVGMDKGDRKAHMKKVEKLIEHEFGKELRNLTFTQGRILLKLIDRETNHTSYELLDDLRGSFRAWFYDGIASLFNYDLKSEYDPHDHLEDRYIEEIVRSIESGQISLK